MLDGDGRNRRVVLLGDMNEEPAAATTQVLLGPPGSEIGALGLHRPDEGDGDRLWNLAPLLPAGQQFSRRYRGRPELIDHIFVSHALLDRVLAVRNSTGPVPPVLLSIDDDPTGQRNTAGSDHAPITVTLNL